MNWKERRKDLLARASELGAPYINRIRFEIDEVEKQGAEAYWENIISGDKIFEKNPNKILIPYLYGKVADDPLDTDEPLLNTTAAAKVNDFIKKNGKVPVGFIKDTDMPDIDIDCLPEARDFLKEYAINKYSPNGDEYGSVCSVGTWQTFKFKSAVIGVAAAMGLSRYDASRFTTEIDQIADDLGEGGYANCKGRVTDENDVDSECGYKHKEAVCPKCGSPDTDIPTIGRLLAEEKPTKNFDKGPLNTLISAYPDIVEYALNIVGRISNLGMHAGALIITDRPVFGNIPLYKNSNKGFWTSIWTEGRNTQLSKFGYIKWDLLGLKTLKYIFRACNLIEENRGISFGENMEGMLYNDPIKRHAGFFFDKDGEKHYIDLDDKDALLVANQQKTDGCFQFDTPLAKCCRFDSRIKVKGGEIEIKGLNQREHAIAYINDENVLQYTNNYLVMRSGSKEIIDVELEDGRVLHLTEDHRVLTKDGYKRIGECKGGDEILETTDFLQWDTSVPHVQVFESRRI